MSKVSHEGTAVEAIKQKLILAESSDVSEFECMGRLFNIHKNVFPPTHFQSTGLFTKNIPYTQNTSFLELGCGAGVTAVTAALEGCYPVVASDISREAVENTLFNVMRHNVNNFVSVRHGDLFDTLEEGESFDVIFWNSNFLFVPENHSFQEQIYHAFYDPGYITHKRFLKEAKKYINPQGKILIGFSSQGNEVAFSELLMEHDYNYFVLYEERGKGENSQIYKIFQLVSLI
ncbi:methyltransferase [Photorhabdus khanii]|uniref:SAM-dependent methyltransferase n=1 Tax=Photorhabdus khanii subsp. guanajuatensis TaxID=2100166 RepID=A0A4R4K026_9GAMM|nr:methyltransferase [Photorhabdus khanii]TDB59766.1 SAM-dependent methyltransferase [Photorhabdus khanii subsp. guanajuatensis]